jgi:hypothetical protein
MGGDARSLQLTLDAMRRLAFSPGYDRAFDLLAIAQTAEQRVEIASGQRVSNDPTEDLPLVIRRRVDGNPAVVSCAGVDTRGTPQRRARGTAPLGYPIIHGIIVVGGQKELEAALGLCRVDVTAFAQSSTPVQRCKDAGDDKARRYRVGPWAIRTGWRPVRPTEQICRSGEGGARSPRATRTSCFWAFLAKERCRHHDERRIFRPQLLIRQVKTVDYAGREALKLGAFFSGWSSITPPSTPAGSIWSRSKSASCAASAWIAESTTPNGYAAKSPLGNNSAMPNAPASNGCSQPKKPAPKWVTHIPTLPKSHNHCAGALGLSRGPE